MTCDYAGDTVINTGEELCRQPACQCHRLCKVFHFHSEAAASNSAIREVENLRPAKLVCLDPGCVINRYCQARIGPTVSPVHVLVQRPVPMPEGRAPKPMAEWTSPEDCPWYGTCDVRHERTAPEDLEVIGSVQSTWQPVRFWCVDPDCRHHRPGTPHVHCPGCGRISRADVRYRELDGRTGARDTFTETDGLCEACYDKWRARTFGSKPD
jgi:hypothetical protein